MSKLIDKINQYLMQAAKGKEEVYWSLVLLVFSSLSITACCTLIAIVNLYL